MTDTPHGHTAAARAIARDRDRRPNSIAVGRGYVDDAGQTPPTTTPVRRTVGDTARDLLGPHVRTREDLPGKHVTWDQGT